MKRLSLDAFKAQQSKQNRDKVDQLLGQTLGDCHDSTSPNHPPSPAASLGSGTTGG